MTPDRQKLERLYRKYNNRRWAELDPINFLYSYDSSDDIEVVGLIAASFAYGRVEQILKSVANILQPLGKRPAKYLLSVPPQDIRHLYPEFRHRFQTTSELAALLIGIRKILAKHSSLQNAFAAAYSKTPDTVDALSAWRDEIFAAGDSLAGHLLPDPRRGSACKRLFMYLRWMVRKDAVDLGVWSCISPAELIFPLDVHMHRQALAFHATARKAADLKAARETTESFKKILPSDPVKYDFALAHQGMDIHRNG
jgi:uncharacterized protein (TIGR02757 family)